MIHLVDYNLDFKRLVEEQARLIGLSRQMPYKPIAYCFGLFYCLIVIIFAAILRIFFKNSGNDIDRALARIYYYVPEMALHKSIELKALEKYSFAGNGLDLGCGNGLVGGVLIKKAVFQNLHGIDLYETNQKMVLENGYAGFSAGDILNMPFETNTFDYLVSICVIEHVKDLTGVLIEANRVLKPAAQFCFTTPAPLFRDSTLLYRWHRFWGQTEKAEKLKNLRDSQSCHYHYLQPDKWHQYLKENGFGNIEIKPIFSRRQLFVYELMNLQVNWMRFYFADKLSQLLPRLRFLKNLMIGAAETISAYYSEEIVDMQNATHFIVSAHKI